MKQYVSVTAIFDEDGNLLPINIVWEDGRKFPIDKVTDVRYAASLKAGGAGIRYTCQIGGKERYLFLEDQRWFVDAKQPLK
ncbi:MAG: hypothetical protein PUD53_03760 [Oscillospiraceae bacterium]|nr:hypothetical protein [Oscillospiraceae bacterium]